MGLSDSARYEIDFRLKTQGARLRGCRPRRARLTFDAVADDGLVIGGQPVKLSIVAVNRGASEVGVTGVDASPASIRPATAQPAAIKKDAVYTCAADVHVPKDAQLTTPYFTDDYWKNPANHAIN